MRRQIHLLVLGAFLLAACQEPAVSPTMTPTAVRVATSTPPPPQPVSTNTPTPTPTTNPTPAVPHIAVTDQVLTDDGLVTLASVSSPQPGWAVIYTVQEDDLGEILGYTAVQAGINKDVTVNVNALDATPSLAVVLQKDEGNIGQFEYPDGPDTPLLFESGIIAQTFNPQFQLSLPIITIPDQEIMEDGLIRVTKVVALTPGWLVIHADKNGELGDYLGSSPITAGANENLTVHIPWQQGTSLLHAVIYADNGRTRQLELADIDIPFLVNGEPIIASFHVDYPPDLFVLDQSIIDGKFEVERVTSNGPGWLVVYYDDDGQPGLIIGYEALADGVNEHVKVEVLHTAVTNPLYIRLHEDTEPGDAFDFPRVDPPVVYQGRQLLPYSFNTEPGNYLVTRDQTPAEAADGNLKILIPYAVVENASWVAIHADDNGAPGEILGATLLKAGLNREVLVEIEAGQNSGTLHAVLHADEGEQGVFENPDGPDIPLQRNRRTLTVPFSLLNPGTETNPPTDE